MKIYITAFLFGLLFLNSVKLFAQNKKLSTEKTPAWVTADTVNYANTSLDNEAEDGYIDIAFEEQVLLEQQTAYYKKAFKIISEAGIQNRSQLSVDFDPSYQRLVFHNITIIRDGKRINKLDLGKIKVVQEETELSRYVYNGALTAVIFLEDVRKGDAIEYSYSVKGFNPVFKGKFSENFDAAYGVPVYQIGRAHV